MLEQVESALNRQDYRTARNLLKTLVHNQPNNDWVHLYAARLQEATDHLENAEKIYKQLLVGSIDAKILHESRRGIQRIQAGRVKKRQAALAASVAEVGSNEPGLLILEPVTSEAKTEFAAKLAEIMQIDPYTARLHLPSRGWRLYRTGSMGELQFYEQQFQQATIPGFSVPIKVLQSVEVLRVNLIEEFRPYLVVQAFNDFGEEQRMTLVWTEVKQIVTGLLPIFEELLEVNSTTTRTTIQRKPKVLDYVQMCDLHVPGKNLILRICNQNYDFKKATGEKTGELTSVTSRENWQRLLSQIHSRTSHAKLRNEFTPFAETALAYPELLQKITPHIQLLRIESSLWDQAFQIYSTLIFNKDRDMIAVADFN